MAEKDDRQSLGGDASPPQNLFLLEHFSGSPDVVPWPGIEPARLTLSNDAVEDIVNDIFLFRPLTVSAPADGRDIKYLVDHPRFYTATDLCRPRQPHFAQPFPPWAVEDHLLQEVAQ